MKVVTNFYAELTGSWTAVFTPPGGRIVSVSDGQSPFAFTVVSEKDYEEINGWIAVDKWLIRTTGLIGAPTNILEDLPEAEYLPGAGLWMSRVGRTLVKIDQDGPFQMEEVPWNNGYQFVPQEV